jgi:quinol-cytochrome oxidoreductase complex cytochrome b subunit
VIGVVLLASLVFSYLISYAVMTALAAQNIISPLPRDSDPRPRWMLTTFVAMVLALFTAAMLLRWTSGRHLSRIDQMPDVEETMD